MQEIDFTLKEGEEYIELTQLLKLKQLAQSGGHAKLIVEEGIVFVNDEQEFRKRKKLRAGDIVQVDELKIVIH